MLFEFILRLLLLSSLRFFFVTQAIFGTHNSVFLKGVRFPRPNNDRFNLKFDYLPIETGLLDKYKYETRH